MPRRSRFRERAGCESVLVTRGEHGMWMLGPDGEHDLPAEAREVSDVTGAGDTVIAAIALGLAGGGSLEAAARLANRAAGLAVSRFGPAAITADELNSELADSGPAYPAAQLLRPRPAHLHWQVDRPLAISRSGFLHRQPFDERVGEAPGNLCIVGGRLPQ